MVVAALVAAGVVTFVVSRGSRDRGRSKQAPVSASDPWGSEAGGPGAPVGPRRGASAGNPFGPRNRPGGPPVQVEGVVRTAGAGTPVAGAEVAFMNDSGEVTAVADGSGHYSIKVTSGVWWKIHARSDSGVGYPEAFLPATEDSQVRDLVVHPLVTIRGRVVDARGSVVTDADVNLEIEAGSRGLLEAALTLSGKTDGAGRFELSALPGAVKVRGVRGMAQGIVVVPNVAPGPATEIEIKLSDPVVVRGRVLDGAKPAAGVRIVALTTLTEGGVNEKKTLDSGADGSFELVMPAGHVRLEARALGRRAPTWVEELASGARRDGVELVLVEELVLVGTVVTTAGEPVTGARVRLIAASSYDGTTDGQGTFEIRVPEKIGYHVKVTHSDGRLEQRVESWDLPPTLVLRRFGSLQIDLSGTTDATVRIDSFVPEGDAAPHAPVDSSFRQSGAALRVASLEPGQYDLTVTAPGAAPVRLPRVAIKELATTTLKVTLAAPVALRGTVRAAGQPVSGAQISIGAVTATSDARGRFALEVAPGPVAIGVTHTGYGSTWVSAVVAADAPAIEVELRKGDGLVDGVGVVLAVSAAGPVVASVLPGSPADGALSVGDRVLAVGGVDVSAAALDEVIARLRGAAGSSVSIKVMRGADSTTVEVVRRRLSVAGPAPTVAMVRRRPGATPGLEVRSC